MSNLGVKSLTVAKDHGVDIYVAELYHKKTHDPNFSIVFLFK